MIETTPNSVGGKPSMNLEWQADRGEIGSVSHAPYGKAIFLVKPAKAYLDLATSDRFTTGDWAVSFMMMNGKATTSLPYGRKSSNDILQLKKADGSTRLGVWLDNTKLEVNAGAESAGSAKINTDASGIIRRLTPVWAGYTLMRKGRDMIMYVGGSKFVSEKYFGDSEDLGITRLELVPPETSEDFMVIDHFTTYNRALTDAEVRGIHFPVIASATSKKSFDDSLANQTGTQRAVCGGNLYTAHRRIRLKSINPKFSVLGQGVKFCIGSATFGDASSYRYENHKWVDNTLRAGDLNDTTITVPDIIIEAGESFYVNWRVDENESLRTHPTGYVPKSSLYESSLVLTNRESWYRGGGDFYDGLKAGKDASIFIGQTLNSTYNTSAPPPIPILLTYDIL
ncbi:hypothetical protein MYOV002v2_p0202 [Vibrio phage 144E46.1]|nr:hypothetical protein MYOV002v2_p0202 [Vibrio phage 144E46.1]